MLFAQKVSFTGNAALKKKKRKKKVILQRLEGKLLKNNSKSVSFPVVNKYTKLRKRFICGDISTFNNN